LAYFNKLFHRHSPFATDHKGDVRAAAPGSWLLSGSRLISRVTLNDRSGIVGADRDKGNVRVRSRPYAEGQLVHPAVVFIRVGVVVHPTVGDVDVEQRGVLTARRERNTIGPVRVGGGDVDSLYERPF